VVPGSPWLEASCYDDVDLFRADPSTWVCGTNITPGWLMDMDEFKARWGGSATQQLVGKFNATQALCGGVGRGLRP
jgi:hypothetical protein